MLVSTKDTFGRLVPLLLEELEIFDELPVPEILEPQWYSLCDLTSSELSVSEVT